MSRLIEVSPDVPTPELALQVGDVVKFAGTGGAVRDGESVELVGVLTPGVVGVEGSVLAPSGPPSTVLFRARCSGEARLEVQSGAPGGPDRPPRDVHVVVS